MAQVAGTAFITLNRAGDPDNPIPIDQVADSSVAFVETKDLDMGTPEIRKWVTEILTDIEGSEFADFRLIIKHRNNRNGELVTLPAKTLEELVKVRTPQAMYFRFRWQDNQGGVPWKLNAFYVYGGAGSARRN